MKNRFNLRHPTVVALLFGGALLARAVDMTPLPLGGFNGDVVVENFAAGPPYTNVAGRMNPTEVWVFYQSGLPGKSYGLPATGSFASAVGDGTTFQLQSYTANNALLLNSATSSSGTLTLSALETYSRVAVLAHSASGGGTANLTFTFADGTTWTTTYSAPDWFNAAGFALQGFERISLDDGSTQGATTNPRLYQTTIDLSGLGAANRPLASITFNQVVGAGATAIYAVSGEIAPQTPAAITLNPTNLTVAELASATFSGGVSGNPYPKLQWLKNGVPISSATNSSYVLTTALAADNNALFRLVVSNFANSVSTVVTSGPATLTVVADTIKPVMLGAQSQGLAQVLVRYSERVKASTATNTANYSLVGPFGLVALSGATLDVGQSNVVLTVAPLANGTNYTLTVNNVADQATAANVIALNSQASFTASVYTPVAIGGGTPGTQVPAGNGLNISGGGTDVGGTSDQFQFSYVQRTNDFDVIVRLDSLSLADAWSEAGLLVREALDAGARMASVMATPTISGCYFQARVTTNGTTTLAGSFPVNYPNTWLRLKRVGNDFTGYAGFDGQNWTQLGTANLTLPAVVYFGFAVSSHNSAQLATVLFRDFGNTAGTGVNEPLTREPLGQSSRRTSLVISEIMYHPTNTLLEFIELFNTRGEPQDLSGYRIAGNVDFTFPPGTSIAGGGFVVVAKSPTDLQNAYGITGVFGPFTNSLPNSSGTVRLKNQSDAVMLEVDYADVPPWPIAADGAGQSLVLAHSSYGENDPQAWAASELVGGSPGRLEPFTPHALRNVVINEFLAHTDPPDFDYIELYNHGNQAVNIGGCVLTDDADTNKFVVPPGTMIPARGFVSFSEATLGFALSAAGESLFFKDATLTRIIDAVQFAAQENGIATGRSPNGAGQFHRLAAKTPGTNNAAILVSDVVINELMYHPINGADDDQYVELFNRSGSPVNLGGWTLDDGVDFTLPSNTVISANGYLVVARQRTQFLSKYPAVNPSIVLGDFSGKLAGSGERVVLTKPDTITSTNNLGVVSTTLIDMPVDEVTYQDGGRWPEWTDGGGSSLELIDPRSNHRLPANWANSDESAKAPWTIISTPGTVDNASMTADQLQILLLGAGECLVDNVQVLVNGTNRIANGTFETDATGWTAEGTESPSSLESTAGYLSSKSYHVRAIERGDNQVNRIRTPLTSSIATGTQNVTISAAVRWLKGHPEVLLRLRGNGLECAGEMALPVAAGTPGARNSRFLTNAPPAITEVAHSPVLPAAGEITLVTARVHDPDGLSSLLLKYRVDPNLVYTSVVMGDNGFNGDQVANDGIFTGQIPSQTAGTLLAFYVSATDAYSLTATATFPSDAPVRESLIRVGEQQPTGNFPVYRIWMTQATLNTWTVRNKLDNTPLDVTFVLGNQRVIYNSEALYAGSPYIAPGFSGPASGRCGYSVDLPKDDQFLGEDSLVLDWPGGHGNETTAMQEQLGYWIADQLNLANSHRYLIRLHVNGVTDTARQAVFEAVQQPARAFVEQWVPDDAEGQFFKIDRAFEFNDGGGLAADPQPRLENYTTTGGAKKREKYRWNFNYRAADRVHDYTSVFALVDALNAPAPEPYTSATFGLVDVEQWMRVFATEHIIVNFDAFGHEIGKNMYAYKPTAGKWQLYMFDLDWLMLAAQGGHPPSSANLFVSEDPTIADMYAYPPFLRAYWRAVEEAVNGPFLPENYNPVMDAKHASLAANGILWCDGAALTGPSAVKTWFATRRNFLVTQLATATFPFAINPTVTASNGVGYITGTAPVGVNTVAINGAPWTVRWTTVSNWLALVPLVTGANNFSVVGLGVNGQVIAGASNSVAVNYGGTAQSPVGAVVISEIMAQPAVPDAEYIELFNTSSNYTHDLSGWNFNGVDYTFPAGAMIQPRSYVVLTRDRTALNQAYGAGVTVLDQFGGGLQLNGETVSLLKPATLPATNQIVVDRVRYEAVAPWAAPVNGSALQLRDASQDNSRVANWSVVPPTAAPAQHLLLLDYSSVWRFMQVSNLDGVSWSVPAFNDAAWPAGAGLLAFENNAVINPLIATTLNAPTLAINNAVSGHAYYFRTKVVITNDLTNFTINGSGYIDDGAVFYVNGNEVTSAHVRMAAGTVTNLSTATSGPPPSNDIVNPDLFTIPASFFGVGTNVIAVEVHQNVLGSSDIVFGLRLEASYAGNPNLVAVATPGGSNSVTTTLPVFPGAWLNEAQADNTTGPLDNFSQREPWVELYNASTNALNLGGYFLSDNYTNLAQWSFASNVTIAAGGFLVVWCDNQTNQTAAGFPHTNFRLSSGSGKVAFSRLVSGTNQIVDYLTYTNLPSNWSYGDVPDAQPFYRANMFYPTAGGTNSGASAPITVFINEWLADNTHTLADSADNNFEDWFEIYNPGTNVVDLGGYWLTDNLTNKFQFQVPNNGQSLVPAHGYLLVWADNEAAQNATNRADLHASFALGKGGEALGIFATDGTTIDAITFGAQTSDVTQGRYQDGSANIVSMPLPTPRAANILPNSPPDLAGIANKEITIGQTLTFTVSATDADVPGQTLTYSLGAGAAPGASIGSLSGIFSWTPSSAPATNNFSVMVADSGTPSLTATQSFSVVVYPRPTLEVDFSGNQMQLSWPRGTLQQADEATGPYFDVTQSSPFFVTPNAARKFFRIRL